MAIWKVSAEHIEIFPHPNADKMKIARVGMFQLVIGKDNGYKNNQIVVFAPKMSILPSEICSDYSNSDTGVSYLTGLKNNRVKSVQLRGEISEGVLLNPDWVLNKLNLSSLEELTIGEDISEKLNITLYEAPIPVGFAGMLKRLPMLFTQKNNHDVESFSIYNNEFIPLEELIITEKIHGSQIALIINELGDSFITSKGMLPQHVHILEDEKNIYWRSCRNTKIIDILKEVFPNSFIQAFGEVIPCQGTNWSYGCDKNFPILRLFRLEINGKRISVEEAKSYDKRIFDLWTNILYKGPYNPLIISDLSKGKETISGKNIHIREGIVIEPVTPRNAAQGFPLYIKSINPKFKNNDEDIS